MTPKKKKNGRAKGNRGQNAVAKLLAPWWGSEFASTPLSGGFATKRFRDDWNAAGDVVTPDSTFPFCVEVKYQEGWNLEQLLKSDKCEPWAWWEQCMGETPEGKIPLLVFRRNMQPWYFMIHAEYRTKLAPNARVFQLQPPTDLGAPVIVGMFLDFLRTNKVGWHV